MKNATRLLLLALVLVAGGRASADEALALMARMYPHREPPLKTRLFLEEILSIDER